MGPIIRPTPGRMIEAGVVGHLQRKTPRPRLLKTSAVTPAMTVSISCRRVLNSGDSSCRKGGQRAVLQASQRGRRADFLRVQVWFHINIHGYSRLASVGARCPKPRLFGQVTPGRMARATGGGTTTGPQYNTVTPCQFARMRQRRAGFHFRNMVTINSMDSEIIALPIPSSAIRSAACARKLNTGLPWSS